MRCSAAAEAGTSEASDAVRVVGLPGLDSICDEFVCKSSPAIESTLRQARAWPRNAAPLISVDG